MKKKLEADLISIAHKILQMKNRSDINALLIETQKLQEKLSVLKFIEEHFDEAKPTIGQTEIEEKIAAVFENHTISNSITNDVEAAIKIDETDVNKIIDEEISTNEISPEVETEVEIQENKVVESEKPNPLSFSPAFELDDDFDEEPTKKLESVQISFEDLLGENYNETLFVKLETKDTLATENIVVTPPKMDLNLQSEKTENATLNETLTKGIKIDLNDRIAFVKHLFGNSNEDYSRVLNQLITYDNFEEAQSFIEDMVKPDYNNWQGKEDYSQRFMDIIEKKFA
jgi:hypothetical protein